MLNRLFLSAGGFRLASVEKLIMYGLVLFSMSDKWLALIVVSIIMAVGSILALYIIVQPTIGEMAPPTLAVFFKTFDRNHDNRVNIAEAEAFFNWCKTNIKYHYDDEQRANLALGIPAGDGRPGPDYWKKPIETFNERSGDCEDMAILNVAFYRYFNIQAYIATVNAEGEEVDHAICIVKIGTNPREVGEYLNGIVYYELEGGYYMLVDVAYSNRIGLVGSDPSETTQLLEAGRFVIQNRITLETAYKMSGWNPFDAVLRKSGSNISG